MSIESYDVIVVGARCAGASVARLLAQRGQRVLMVDRATFPSDTVSTHCVTIGGVIQLQRWGLLDRVVQTNVPALSSAVLTIDDQELPVTLDTVGWVCPRRTVLDKILVDAAREAGAELREGITVRDLLRDGERVTGIIGHDQSAAPFEARAAVTVGADGTHSFVARSVDAPTYDVRPSAGVGAYAYFAGIPPTAVQLAFGNQRGCGFFPTNDGQTCVFAAALADDAPAHEVDVGARLRESVGLASKRLGDLLGDADRQSRYFQFRAEPGRFCKPYGPGWALVGDAGYYKDPITGHGITDAFRDAELLAIALDNGLSGRAPLEEALGGYQARRDELSQDVYEATQTLAAFDAGEESMTEVFLRFVAASQAEAEAIAAFG